jgi:hypothetical protein
MKAEEFNALPLEARQFIEKQKGCISCGGSRDINALYQKYLSMKKTNLYTLRMGAIPFKTEDGESGLLYPLHPADSEDTILQKLQTAKRVHAVAPAKFADFQAEKINAYLDNQDAKDGLDDNLGGDGLDDNLGGDGLEDDLKANLAGESANSASAKQGPILYGAAKKAAEAKAEAAKKALE